MVPAIKAEEGNCVLKGLREPIYPKKGMSRTGSRSFIQQEMGGALPESEVAKKMIWQKVTQIRTRNRLTARDLLRQG